MGVIFPMLFESRKMASIIIGFSLFHIFEPRNIKLSISFTNDQTLGKVLSDLF